MSLDLWGYGRAASLSPDEDMYVGGQCASWAVAHQRQYPHLRFGIDWQKLTPDHPDWDEEDEGDEIWQPQHIFTHDDTHAYDVRGAHPLAEVKQWDDLTLNHSPEDVMATGMYEGGYEPPAEVVRHVRPHTASRIAMPIWHHLTDDPDFKLNPDKVPVNYNYPETAGVFLTQRPEEWANDFGRPFEPSKDEWSGDRPYVAEIDAPDHLHTLPGVKYDPDATRPGDRFPGSDEVFVPADQFHHLNVQQVRPRKANLMTAAVTVYTQPNCPQCMMTKKQLDKLGIDHDTVDVTQDPDAHAYVSGLGYSSAPVVVVGDGESHWSGFRPDHLRGLVE